MSDEQSRIDVAVYTTVFESIVAIFKNVLTIEQMKKMVLRLEQYVNDEEKRMNR